VRGNASKYANAQQGRTDAEARLVAHLCNVAPALRSRITAETIVAGFNVTEKVAKYRLALRSSAVGC
jgi:hypothetical protein